MCKYGFWVKEGEDGFSVWYVLYRYGYTEWDTLICALHTSCVWYFG